MWREALVTSLRHYSNIFLQGMKKTTKTLSRDSLTQSPELNQGNTACEGMLSLDSHTWLQKQKLQTTRNNGRTSRYCLEVEYNHGRIKGRVSRAAFRGANL